MQYLFNLNPGYQFKFAIPVLIIFALMIIVAILIRWRMKRQDRQDWQKIRANLVNLFLTTGIIGLILLFFRIEGISFFSARFWWVILLLVFLIWLIMIAWHGLKILPKELKKKKEEEEFRKYLPTKEQ